MYKELMCNKCRFILCDSVKQTFKDVGGCQGNNKELIFNNKSFYKSKLEMFKS